MDKFQYRFLVRLIQFSIIAVAVFTVVSLMYK